MSVRFLLIGILWILNAGNSEPTIETGSEKTLISKDCHSWLKDSTLSSGGFVRYIRNDDVIKIEWGNAKFKRIIEEDYSCNAAPHWIPTTSWSTAQYIGLNYGCGNPCWGVIILPLTPSDPVVQRMYDFDHDLNKNLIVYLDNKSYDVLIIENWATGKKQEIKPKVNCNPSFLGYCIDSIRFINDKLYIKWEELDEAGKSNGIVVDLIKVQL